MLRAVVACALVAAAAAAPLVPTQPRYLAGERSAERPTYAISLLAEEARCVVLAAGWGQVHRLAATQVYTTSVPDHLSEDDGEDSADDFVQIFAPTAVSAWGRCAEMCHAGLTNSTLDAEPARLQKKRDVEIRPVRESGDPDVRPPTTARRLSLSHDSLSLSDADLRCCGRQNRIDVVFMGDGYTEEERELHFADMERLVDDMWGDTTFASYLPLL